MIDKLRNEIKRPMSLKMKTKQIERNLMKEKETLRHETQGTGQLSENHYLDLYSFRCPSLSYQSHFKGKLETIILKMKPNSCNVETLTMEQFAENMKRRKGYLIEIQTKTVSLVNP